MRLVLSTFLAEHEPIAAPLEFERGCEKRQKHLRSTEGLGTQARSPMRTLARRPESLRVLAALVACSVLGGAAAGCGRKIGEADCRKVADHLGEIWKAEAKSEETDGPGKDKAQDVIRQEGERLTREWVEECRKDLVGKRVEEKELTCLLATKTMTDVQKCAESQ